MKYTKVLGLAVAATLAFGACSDDWDEHYDAKPIGNGGSLWEAIVSDAELSNFAQVLDSCGYAKSLDGAQVFTVFAPTNNQFTEDDAKKWIQLYKEDVAKGVKEDDNIALKQFVKNHIALYNFSVSSASNDTLDMMNGKRLPLSNSSFGGQTIESFNERYSNGILFKIDGETPFFHNIFEYLASDSDLDSVAEFLYKFNEYKFMPSMSVEGGIIDGQTWYLDSVEILENELLEQYLGLINSEDSTYKMVVPVNSEWERLVAEYEPYFNYPDNVENRDSLVYANARMAILRGTVFSQTINPSWQDSAVSTEAIPYNIRKNVYGSSDADYYVYRNPYRPGGEFESATEIECSNGQLLKADQWNISKEKTFCQTLLIEAESNWSEYNEQMGLVPSTLNFTSNDSIYDEVSNHAAMYLVQKTGEANPWVEIDLRNVLSGVKYDIQMVLAPSMYHPNYSDTIPLPNIFSAYLNYPNQDGTMNTDGFGDGDLLVQFMQNEKPAQMDTITLAEGFQFPTCAYGLGTSTEVKLRVYNEYMQSMDEGKCSKHLLIDCIILKPQVEETEE